MPRLTVKHRAAGVGSNRLALRAAAPYNSIMLLVLPLLLLLAPTAPARGPAARGRAVRGSPSKDGLSWPFPRRDGVRFHDGTALTAQHVVASLERQVSPDHPLYPNPVAVWPRVLRGVPGVVKEIRALDVKTLQISLVLPYAPLLTLLAHPAFSVINAVPGDAGPTRWLGTGPFRIAEVTPARVVLDANPGFWGGPPRVDRIVFLEVAEEQGEADLESRRLDVWIPPTAPRKLEGALSIPGWKVGLLGGP